MASMKWHGPAFERKVRAHMGRNLVAACIALANYAKKLISTEGTEKEAPGRDAKGRYTKGRLKYGANPSKPGEPPHLQTGRLMGSIAWELVDLLGRVGTNLKYGRLLENGTKRMAKRPWLKRSLAEMQAAIRRMLTRPMP